MKKTYKIFLSIVILLFMALSTIAGALAVEPYAEGFRDETAVDYLTGGFYITGGSVSKDEVMRGDSVDTSVRVKFTKPAEKWELQLYFVADGLSKPIKTFSFSKPHEIGDVVIGNIYNIDTDALGDEWCGKYIKIAGFHWVYQVDDNTGQGRWVEDYLSSTGIKRTISENFKLVCGDKQCSPSQGDRFCSTDNSRVQVEQVLSDCSETITTVDFCKVSEQCENGACVTKPQCVHGTTSCYNDNTQISCTNGLWDSNTVTACNNGCQDDKCISDTTEPNPDDGSTTPELAELYFVSRGSCISELLPVNTGNTYQTLEECQANISNGGTTRDFNILDYYLTNPVAAWFLTILGGLSIVLIVFLIVPKKRKGVF